MARIVRRPQPQPESQHEDLVAIICDELGAGHQSGQPRIEESHLENGSIQIRVYWDEWLAISEDERSNTILTAYHQGESNEFNQRISVATGLTFPEATEIGLLPFQIVTMLRSDDEFTVDQLQAAMLKEGASVLAEPYRPQLRFGTEREAHESLQRLRTQLPGSDPIWAISKDVGYVSDFIDG